MSDLAVPPGRDEIEVAVIGPGFGEAVLVHIGDGKWIVVDSCQHPDKSRSATLEYLEAMGFDPDVAVICIVVTHFDKDHIKGLTDIVRAAPNAKYVAALATLKADFVKFAHALAGDPTRAEPPVTDEIARVFEVLTEQKRSIMYAAPGRRIYEIGTVALSHQQDFELTTLSPTDYEQDVFVRWMMDEMPMIGGRKLDPPKRIRNDLSVVLLIRVGALNILLGGDLEEEGDARTGWSAILAQRASGTWAKSSVFKVPHHGSETGHHSDVWSEMLDEKPVSILAPWFNGDGSLPKEDDRLRILNLSGAAYTTATARTKKLKKRSPAVERTMKETLRGHVSDERIPGIVRARTGATGGAEWTVDLFDEACPLQDWPTA